jgi:hypothetical protein
MKLTNLSAVRETDFGVYYWVTKNGTPVVNSEGHNLCIQAHRNDKTAVAKLRSKVLYEAKGHPSEDDIVGGRPVFEEGVRLVSEEEYQTQVQRLEAGLEPDPLNIPDAISTAKKLGYKFR